LALFLGAYLHQDYKADILGHIFGVFLISWGAFLLLLGGLHLDFLRGRLWAPLAFPGTLSYGGYLLHPAILFFLWPLLTGRNDFGAFAIYASATFFLAYLSYRFFEMPVNTWVRRTWGRSR
jgi:peptidoglycan/LPS O-acetylase OafA/YrhL